MDVIRMMFTLLFLCLLFCSSFVTAISPISAKGTKLYDNDGNQFFIKGVAYVPGAGRSDPLVDTKQCKTDAALINKVGANTIYVYSVDTRNNHDGCMQEFANKGIYVWLQLGELPQATDTTKDEPQWTKSVFSALSGVLDAFAGYDNVLALGIGQETIRESSESTAVAPSLKAAARDLRAYRKAQDYRPIPLSYSVADDDEFRRATTQYLTCGDAPDETVDLIGLNIFLNCAPADWSALAAQVRDIPVPVAISESGCRGESNSRNFSEVALVLGQGLNDVFSGISIYEWAMEDTPSYGIVKYANDARTGIPELLPQYSSLAAVFSSAKATGTPAAKYTPASSSALACPTKDVDAGWLVDPNTPLPTIAGLQLNKGTVTGSDAGGSRTTGTPDNDSDNDDSSQDNNSQNKTLPATTPSNNGPSLSTGAIAGIVVGTLTLLILLALAILICLRRRRRTQAADAAYQQQQQHQQHSHHHHHHHHTHHPNLPEMGHMHDPTYPPPSYKYHYPANKAELPIHNMAAVEIDDGAPRSGSGGSAASWATSESPTRAIWKLPIQGGGVGGGREDSPTVAEGTVPVERGRWWRRTRQFELEDTGTVGAGTVGGRSWVVSPLTPPGGKYV